MGYAFVMGYCFTCGGFMTFNPVRVPSIRDANGVRQPVCKGCIDRANIERAKTNMPPLTHAEDAYEACEESELV